MKSRKQIRKELQRQKRSQLYRKGAATTTVLVSTLNLVPVSALATSVEESNDTGVQVVEQPTVASSDDTADLHDLVNESQASQATTTEDTGTETSLTEDTDPTVSSSESTTSESLEEPLGTEPASDVDSAESTSEIPMLSEAERIALETKIMPNIDRVMARSNTQQAFIQQVGPMAQQVASVNDL